MEIVPLDCRAKYTYTLFLLSCCIYVIVEGESSFFEFIIRRNVFCCLATM